jgi:hypothetical protein
MTKPLEVMLWPHRGGTLSHPSLLTIDFTLVLRGKQHRQLQPLKGNIFPLDTWIFPRKLHTVYPDED